MRLHRLALVPATGALALLLATSPAAAGGRPLSADLTGAAEAPGPGDPDGRGTARITVNPGLGEICYQLKVSGIAPATAAHIHEAPAGEAGPVLVALAAPTNGSSSGCVAVSREDAKDLLKNSSDYYVNVHNAEFPRGALRGQL
ncbi:MAG TPA: CHRD domain-containing protein [Acidimicrobiales bacterium]|nr:CHRD domain-containing protein [Acidimicrobiales bacterium]